MMKFKSLFLLLSIVFTQLYVVQAQEKDVLFTIDDAPVYTSEFIRVYNKNLDLVKDESQKDIDGYLKLFINYKLKLQEAKTLKLDQKPSYLKEFNTYKKQLAKNYISDSKVTEALVKEAYNRLQTEINASHILVRVDESASPQDTLKAYNKLLELKDRVINEGYKKVQKEVHNGKTIYAEDLGYFSAFKMVYPFENAAFNTKKGQVSQPFRTRFGYHIVTVFNKRKSRGKVSVAHIMIKTKKDNIEEGETKINEIYKRFKQGEAFDALAKQLSEDKSSSSKGGVLKPFGGGELSATEFEEVAFGLENVNDVSKPFKTQFGWHIVKLMKPRETIAPFEKMAAELQSKIKRDSRSKVISDSRVKTLKAKYKVTENPSELNYFKSILTKQYFTNRWRLPAINEEDKTILKIENKLITYKDFGKFLTKSHRGYINKPSSIAVVLKSVYSSFIEAELIKFQEENLIIENKDYAQIVGEYRDGLLLFDLMETEIWNIGKKDSVAVANYFETNKTKYFFPERLDAVVASSAKKSKIKKIAKLMQKGKDEAAIKKIINTNNQVNVSFTSGAMDKQHQALPKTLQFKTGLSKIYKHNDAFVVVKVKQVLPKKIKTFKEAKGQVTSDYQSFKEKQWLEKLATKYIIKVNEAALVKVKQNINK